jgi:hypothetical protein
VVGLRSFTEAICEHTVIGWVAPFGIYDDIGVMAGTPPHPPLCFLTLFMLGRFMLLDSFKYSARICRTAMRFVKARLEKHFRVPFLHTL